jgi:hypothetical protein
VLFGAAALPRLRHAVADLSWLLGRGYAPKAALALVGDRLQLRERQRRGVARCACSDAARRDRQQRHAPRAALRRRTLHVDGYNVLTTVQVALAGGLLLRGRDGCWRDLAGMHGRAPLASLGTAIDAVGGAAARLGARRCTWYLDRPVSHSGRLAELLVERASANRWRWVVEVVNDPDPVLAAAAGVVATSDSVVLDRCGLWIDLAGVAIAAGGMQALHVDLGRRVARPEDDG